MMMITTVNTTINLIHIVWRNKSSFLQLQLLVMMTAALVGFQCVFDGQTKPLVDCITADEMYVIINGDTDQSACNGQFV